jgi:high-affinity nickel-transport protein
MTIEPLLILSVGFALGIRHATDPDHVVAVTTIVTRQRDVRAAALTGFLWGAGHSLTVVLIGCAVILFNLVIPPAITLGMEISVGVMLVVLGFWNVVHFWPRGGGDAAPHVHRHGDYVHVHARGGTSEPHPHHPERTPLARLDRRFDRLRVYQAARPVIVGVVHGLAGSAAVALLVVAAVSDPWWAVGYLLLFGTGTIAGMMVITVSLASTLRLIGGRSDATGRRLALAAGVASIVFGLTFAYDAWAGGLL